MTTNTNTKLSSLVLAALVVFSVFAGSFAFAGTVAATHNVEDIDATITDGNNYWTGQNLLYDADANEELTLYQGVSDDGNSDEFVREIVADEDGHYILGTSELSGSYYIENSDGTTVDFEVRTQTLSAEFDSEFVSNGDSGNTVELDVDSNRASSNIEVVADGLDDEDLRHVFAEYGTEDTDFFIDSENNTVLLANYNNNNNNQFDLNFTGIDSDEYTFEFDVIDTDAATNASITVNDAGDANAQFSESVYVEERGDIVEFTVELESTNTADIYVGSDDVGYEADLTVTDHDGDDEVTVYFNTYTAGDGTGDAFSTHEDSDDTVTVSESNLDVDKLQQASYDLSASAAGEETDVATISLNERSTDGVEIMTAPANAELDSVEDILDYATVDDTIAMQDKVIVGIEASGLEGSALDSSADLVEGSAFAQTDGAYVTVEQQNPKMNRNAKTLDVSQGTLVQDGDNNTHYLVFNTNDLNVNDGEEYEATFTLDENSDFVSDEDATEEVSNSFSLVERMVNFDAMTEDEDGDDLLSFDLAGDDTITVSGDTTIAAGSEFNLRVRSAGESPFLKSAPVTVEHDGTFASTFDMSGVSEDAEFTVEARGLTDRINAQLTTQTASVSASDASAEGSADTVTADSADLPRGGFLVVHADDGSALGVSDYLEAGQHSNIEINLDEPLGPGDHTVTVMAHQDDGNEVYDDAETDAPYTIDGEPVTADATISVHEMTYTVTVNVDGADNADVTLGDETAPTEDGVATFEVENGDYDVSASADGFEDASTTVTVDGADESVSLTLEEVETGDQDEGQESDGETEDPGATEEETPGFGAVLALIALAGAALISLRRRD